MAMSECPYCGGERKPLFSQVDREMWNRPEVTCELLELDGEHILEVSVSSEAWVNSFAGPVNFCPMCGRDLRKVMGG